MIAILGVLQKTDIDKISNTMTHNEWKEFLPRLELHKKITHKIKEATPKCVELTSLGVLLVWRNRNYEECTVFRLIEILEGAGKVNPRYRWAVNELRENIGKCMTVFLLIVCIDILLSF